MKRTEGGLSPEAFAATLRESIHAGFTTVPAINFLLPSVTSLCCLQAKKSASPAAGGASSSAAKALAAPAKPAAPHVAKPLGPNVKMEVLGSRAELPAKFRRQAMSADEMAMIDVRPSRNVIALC